MNGLASLRRRRRLPVAPCHRLSSTVRLELDEQVRRLVKITGLFKIHSVILMLLRLGTFTAIDICLAQAKAENAVDVRGVVARIRQQRACSVQMAKQYAFIYQAVYTRLRQHPP